MLHCQQKQRLKIRSDGCERGEQQRVTSLLELVLQHWIAARPTWQLIQRYDFQPPLIVLEKRPLQLRRFQQKLELSIVRLATMTHQR